MVRVIALTQFLFITLGTLALMVLMKARTVHDSEMQSLRFFLSHHGFWLVLIPLAWVVIVHAIQSVTASEKVFNVLRGSGIALAGVILAVYLWLIFSF